MRENWKVEHQILNMAQTKARITIADCLVQVGYIFAAVLLK